MSMISESITTHGSDFCVIDTHNLFVCATLEDEILVLGGDESLLPRLADDARAFGLNPSPGRRLDSYSGGEQAILCCVLLAHLLPQNPGRILLVRVLETLSAHNRDMLTKYLARKLPRADLFTLTPDGPYALGA